MATVLDVAKYILEEMGRLSTWKLQKLCYYSQAWSLAWTEVPIFQEDFEAWVNGPVCPELFHKHKGMYSITTDDFPFGDSSNLSEDQKDTIDIVIRDYGVFDPYDLREISHSEAPWKNTRGDLDPKANCTRIITKDCMGEYYGSL